MCTLVIDAIIQQNTTAVVRKRHCIAVTPLMIPNSAESIPIVIEFEFLSASFHASAIVELDPRIRLRGLFYI